MTVPNLLRLRPPRSSQWLSVVRKVLFYPGATFDEQGLFFVDSLSPAGFVRLLKRLLGGAGFRVIGGGQRGFNYGEAPLLSGGCSSHLIVPDGITGLHQGVVSGANNPRSFDRICLPEEWLGLGFVELCGIFLVNNVGPALAAKDANMGNVGFHGMGYKLRAEVGQWMGRWVVQSIESPQNDVRSFIEGTIDQADSMMEQLEGHEDGLAVEVRHQDRVSIVGEEVVIHHDVFDALIAAEGAQNAERSDELKRLGRCCAGRWEESTLGFPGGTTVAERGFGSTDILGNRRPERRHIRVLGS
ncbi:hypothetical protein BDK51DRAFT_33274 [Blyttiomyces helicus]|uniref:Uncharacterized protein n=1 Tax=Blyttiomyces helicus TaxID=388810 RepID=A0A4P9WJS6_9FUNG|nr:hypothetical protein BDK51DRAFT_33274 [Blyttiomyces helicus]|eukprot:RKO91788.1 hypothetical protein BDK51DRAFT_33274 [Blyttiomyces helicus]